jgi:hypothetical protein
MELSCQIETTLLLVHLDLLEEFGRTESTGGVDQLQELYVLFFESVLHNNRLVALNLRKQLPEQHLHCEERPQEVDLQNLSPLLGTLPFQHLVLGHASEFRDLRKSKVEVVMEVIHV